MKEVPVAAKESDCTEGARRLLKNGVTARRAAASITLDLELTNVINKSGVALSVTKERVTVAEEIDRDAHFRSLGAQGVRDASSTTSDVAGDGTQVGAMGAIRANGEFN